MIQFEEWLKAYHPVPEKDRVFYESWGYEQWHIKTHKQDMAQARILYRHEYDMCRLIKHTRAATAAGVEDWLRTNERPLVKTSMALHRFGMVQSSEGAIGISVWANDDSHLCIVPGRRIGPFVGDVPKAHLTELGILFESNDQVLKLNEEAQDGD